MNSNEKYKGGENFDLQEILLHGKNLRLAEKTEYFNQFLNDLHDRKEIVCMRQVCSPSAREVQIFDEYERKMKTMLMFGSNNYLGLANHPYVKAKTEQAIHQFGAGIGGPPLLNGFTKLHRELELRLADLKGAEDALIFSSGYGANVGLLTALLNKDSIVVYDAYSHASFCDGLKLSGAQSFAFPHNDVRCLEQRLINIRRTTDADIFIGVEGVYSMDGDLAMLDIITEISKKYNAYLIVDDAHGTGVTGKYGKGTAEYFDVEDKVDLTMGTFSKTFAVTGGFAAGKKEIINYLRYFARSYMFSASLPPMSIAAVLAGLDLLQYDDSPLLKLRENIDYTAHKFAELGLGCNSVTPIFPIIVPVEMNIRKASYDFHKRGIFINSIEYPAVPVNQQRFRISVTAEHTKEDIDRLAETIEEVWNENLVLEQVNYNMELV